MLIKIGGGRKGNLSYLKIRKDRNRSSTECRFNSQDEWNGNLDGRIERALDKKSIAVEDESTILFFPPSFSFQTILLGDSGVGKTSLLVQFDTGKFQPGNFAATVGIGFTVRILLFYLSFIY